MKKRLISLLLAFSMMLTFLPAGAVSAFAEEPIDPSKGTLLHSGDIITDSRTYQLSGPYTQGITIDTEGPVEINVTGNVTVDFPENNKNYYFITIKKAGSVTINDDAQYPVIVNGGDVISNLGENLTINGGKYICNGRNPYSSAFTLSNGSNRVENVTVENVTIESKYTAIWVGYACDSAVIENSNITAQYTEGADAGGIVCFTEKGTLDLNHVTVHALEGSALRFIEGIITINGGTYTAKNGYVIGPTDNVNEDLNLTINGGTFQGNDRYTVANFGCYEGYSGRTCNIQIHGGRFVGGQLLAFYGSSAETLTIDGDTTFESTGSTFDAVVVGNGQLIFNSGTIEVSGDSARSALRTFEKGEAIVNDGTFKGAKYDIYERNRDVYRGLPPCRVQLNHANFGDNVCNVYLEEDRQIDVAQNYTGQVTIECKDPKDGRQLTKDTETNYQKDLNLTSANAGYLVGYKTKGGKEYRCLSKEVGVTVSNPEGEVKAGNPAKFTVTLAHAGSTGTGILTFGDKNSEIEYKDKNGAYQPMPKDGLEVDLSGDKNDYVFRIIPQKAGEQKLTAAVVRDAVELGTADKNFTVADRVHTTVTIEGLEDAVIKEGESKDFTVKVDPKDDANLGEAFIDFGDKNSEIEYKDEESGEYKPMPEGGLPIDLRDGEKPYAFRITPKTPGQQTLTAVVKKGEKELASNTTNLTGTEMPTLSVTGGNVTVEKDGQTLNIVPVVTGDKKTYSVPEGATVSVAFDKDAFADSGLKFGHWDITGLDDPVSHS